MMSLAAVFARVPKLVLFGAAGLIQVAPIALMVANHVEILRTGVDVKLETRPVAAQEIAWIGHVTLDYDISTVRDAAVMHNGAQVFVKPAPDRDGSYRAVSVHAAPVDVNNGEVLIHGRVHTGIADIDSKWTTVRYGIESYFVPKNEVGKLEAARNARKLTVVVTVTPTGRAAIRRLLIDGAPVYDEPWF
jgi:uncharacterized membrane-anchored protein